MYMQMLSGLGDVSVGVQVRAQCDQEVGLVVRVVGTDRFDDIEPAEIVLGDVVADLQQVEFDLMVLVQAGNWGLRGRFRAKLVQQMVQRAYGFGTRPR